MTSPVTKAGSKVAVATEAASLRAHDLEVAARADNTGAVVGEADATGESKPAADDEPAARGKNEEAQV
ncbi:MAG: hypothetical protein KA244_04400 [Deltaproteobacteria bacterium]|nr:hypothetical protein [Deltaproteobacteria bacterium]